MNKVLISHVGIAVKNLDEAIRNYKLMTGINNPEIEEVAEQKVKVAMFSATGSHHDGGNIELLGAVSDDSPIAKFIEKKGEGLHHICIFVDDIDLHLEKLKEQGVRLIDNTPRIGAGGCRIAFVHPAGANSVLIELQERRIK